MSKASKASKVTANSHKYITLEFTDSGGSKTLRFKVDALSKKRG